MDDRGGVCAGISGFLKGVGWSSRFSLKARWRDGSWRWTGNSGGCRPAERTVPTPAVLVVWADDDGGGGAKTSPPNSRLSLVGQLKAASDAGALVVDLERGMRQGSQEKAGVVPFAKFASRGNVDAL